MGILYGEKMQQICDNLGVDITSLDDRLYSTLLQCICECTQGGTLKEVIDTTGCIAFPYSVATSFDDVLNEENTENLVSAYRMFEGCINLVHAPMMDTSGVINAMYMFYGCAGMTTVPAYDFSAIPETIAYAMFYNCTSLKSMLATGIRFDLDLSASTNFETNDLVTIMTNLATVTGKTLTIGATNLDKLTNEQKAIATSKGWTLA